MNVETTNRDFGWALSVLKDGGAVARAKWVRKGTYLFLVRGTISHPLVADGAEVEALPSFGMCTVNAQGQRVFIHGWFASQCDMLAEDWMLADHGAGKADQWEPEVIDKLKAENHPPLAINMIKTEQTA